MTKIKDKQDYREAVLLKVKYKMNKNYHRNDNAADWPDKMIILLPITL